MVTWRLPLNGNEVQCALPTFSTGGRHENNVINWYVWLLVKPASLQLENTVCSRILRQVQPILPLQTRRHEAPSQEVVTPPKLEGRFFGSGQRDEHVRLESVDTAPLHVPSLNTHHNIQVLFFFLSCASHRASCFFTAHLKTNTLTPLTWRDVHAGYGHRSLIQNLQDGTKWFSHCPFKAEAKDGVHHQVVRLINDRGLIT